MSKDTKLVESLIEAFSHAGYNCDRSTLKINTERLMADNLDYKIKNEFIALLLDDNNYNEVTDDDKNSMSIMVSKPADYWEGV